MRHKGQHRSGHSGSNKQRHRIDRSAEARAWLYAVSKLLGALAGLAVAAKLVGLGV